MTRCDVCNSTTNVEPHGELDNTYYLCLRCLEEMQVEHYWAKREGIK